jgi:serine phosphatase RsbU (regulator of sigma subunit)
LTSLTVLAVGGVAERRTRDALTRELENRLVLEARNLALTSTGALLSEFPELTLQPILAEMRSDVTGFLYAAVVDHQNLVRAHPDARRLGTPFRTPDGLVDEETTAGLRVGERLLADATMLVAFSPVRHPTGETIGTAVVAANRDVIDALIREARRNELALLALLLAGSVLCSFFLMSHLLRPIGLLREGLERIGRGDFSAPVRLRDRTELGLLAETMNEMAARIRGGQEEMVERRRLARELELAREIQASLLPASGNRTREYVTEGFHRDAAEVGGDIYDIFPLPNGRVGIAIADVSGKGLAGCLVAAMLSALLGSLRGEGGSPRTTLLLLEKHLVRMLRPGTFVTIFYGALDPMTGKLTFASAGHTPLLLYRAKTGSTELVRSRGIPLGAVKGPAFSKSLEESEVALAPGDAVVLFTDGVNESFDPAGAEQFGFDRLRKTVETAAPRGGRAVIDTIREGLDRWRQDAPPSDDETLLVVARETSRWAGELVAQARRDGESLRLQASLDSLAVIGDWISKCRDLAELPSPEHTVLESALYEACANVIEHGYGEDRDRSLDLHWLPATTKSTGPRAGTSKEIAARVREGCFLLVDQGIPFAPHGPQSLDFGDPVVRRRGRGIGLEIIRGAMREVTFLPETPEGNVTMFRFDPEKVRSEEVRHVP